MGRVLIVDDLPSVRGQIESALSGLDAELLQASDGGEALETLAATPVNVVVTDVRMPHVSGLDLMRRLRDPQPSMLVHSGYADVKAALEAVRLGALDFFPAPIDFARLRARVDQCLRRDACVSEHLVGTSDAIVRLRALIPRLAGERGPILITGETGTGKEVAAREVHRAGPDPSAPFVVLGCGGLRSSGSVREAVLDGAPRGGTLLLDEISELAPAEQGDLLRALDESLLAEERDPAPARVVAATACDLPMAVAKGRFREELWYRISAFRIHLPPLRERPADVAAIASGLLRRLSEEHAGIPFELDEGGLEWLARYEWPGNVRELELALRRMTVLAGERRLLDAYDVEEALRIEVMASHPRACFEQTERDRLVAALDAHRWNVSATARALGMTRGGLRSRMTSLGLD